jgi:glutamate formiminotransferase / 5-formyltetrahydrofolate cyclo-ligase
MPTPKPLLLAVPNASDGRDQTTVQAIANAFTAGRGTRLLDVHADGDHHRSVYTLAGAQGELQAALLAGARAAVERIDVGEGRDAADVGEHPHVGALDVMPLVYVDATQRGAACAEALVVAHEIGARLDVPVLMYGELAQGRTRAELRRGGVAGLGRRLLAGELRPDFGPARPHPTAGATLVAAREPLVAFNLELAAPASVEDARRIASLIREGGPEGIPGVRAIGVPLRRPTRGESRKSASPTRAWGGPAGDVVAQVSTNVERPLETPLRVVVEAVRRHARIGRAELVGLAPRAAFEGFPEDVELGDFDPDAHILENALGL